LNFILGLYKFGHFGTPVPLVHELDLQKVTEEGYLFQFCVQFVFADQSVQGNQLSFADHAVFADRYVVVSLFLFRADLVLVYAFDFHVHELVALGALQHRNYFGNC
jgi:hypothetical protein